MDQLKSVNQLKTVWLHLCEQGGQWTVREIMDALPEVGVGIASILCMGAERGFFRALPRKDRRYGSTFGVTLDCKVPRSVTWRELREAAAFAERQGEAA